MLSGHNSKNNKERNKGFMVGGVYADSCNLSGHKGIELLTYNLCQQLRAINRIHGGTLYFFWVNI